MSKVDGKKCSDWLFLLLGISDLPQRKTFSVSEKRLSEVFAKIDSRHIYSDLLWMSQQTRRLSMILITIWNNMCLADLSLTLPTENAPKFIGAEILFFELLKVQINNLKPLLMLFNCSRKFLIEMIYKHSQFCFYLGIFLLNF